MMRRPRTLMSMAGVASACTAIAVACAIDDTGAPPADGKLALGTWGGDSAGVIVQDTLAHVHIACTFGDIAGRVVTDASGNFSVSGSYLLRAYPVAIGPTMPAQFNGHVVGSTLMLTVVVNDTVAHATVIRGPIVVQLGKDPKLGPCPICKVPGDRATNMASNRTIR